MCHFSDHVGCSGEQSSHSALKSRARLTCYPSGLLAWVIPSINQSMLGVTQQPRCWFLSTLQLCCQLCIGSGAASETKVGDKVQATHREPRLLEAPGLFPRLNGVVFSCLVFPGNMRAPAPDGAVSS